MEKLDFSIPFGQSRLCVWCNVCVCVWSYSPVCKLIKGKCVQQKTLYVAQWGRVATILQPKSSTSLLTDSLSYCSRSTQCAIKKTEGSTH